MGIVIFPTSPWGKLHYSVIPRVSSQWAFSAINVSMILLVCPSPWYLSWVVERLKIREPFVWKLELVLRQELHSNSGKTELSLTFYLPVDNTGVELPATLCVFLRSAVNLCCFRGFAKEYLAVGELLVSSTLEVYKNAMANLLPTPAKSHYLFNLRDFARVIQGTLLSTPDIIEDPDNLKRLWCHEVCYLQS